MHVEVEVAVALRRPPAEHAKVYCSISVELPDHEPTIEGLSRAIDTGTQEARLIACEMAACHPRVVMPVRATVIEVCCV